MSREKMFLRFVLTLLGSVALLALSPTLAQAQTFLLEWGTPGGGAGSGPGEFNAPGDVAEDGSGNVYVFDAGNYRIQKFDSSGGFVLEFGPGPGQNFNSASGIAADGLGNVWVTATGSNGVQKYDSSGSFQGVFGTDTQYNDVAVDGSGNVYVCDYLGRLRKFDPSGSILIDVLLPGGSGPGQVNNPVSIGVDAAGNNIYVGESGNNRVQKFDSSFSSVLTWGTPGGGAGNGPGEFDVPRKIDVDDASGEVYVSSANNNRVQRFDSNGNYISMWGSYGSNPGQFITAAGVAVDGPNHVVYVSDISNSRIQKFDISVGSSSNALFLLEWGTQGANPGEFNSPVDVAADGSGNVYVLDSGNSRIQKFDNDGVFDSEFGPEPGQGFTSGLAVDGAGNIWVVDGGNGVQKYNSSGAFQGDFGTDKGYNGVAADGAGNAYTIGGGALRKFDPSGNILIDVVLPYGDGLGEFNGDVGIALDGTGNIYVVESGNNRVQKFDGSFNPLLSWGTPGSGSSEFDTPQKIAVDGSGDVFVSDLNNNRVQKFDPNGNFLTEWGSYGSNPGQFIVPRGIAVDGAGNVFVSDANNSRIQKFTTVAVAVSLPSVTATHGQTLVVPVSIDNAAGLVSAEIFIEYDTDVLTVFSAPQSPTSSTGTLTDSWSVQTNTEPGAGTLEILKIATATDENLVTGAQTLINVNFTVNDPAPQPRVPASSALTLTHVLLNDGTPGNAPVDGLVTLVGNDGTIDSSPAQVAPPDNITVTVVDLDEDLDGSGSTDQVTVDVVNGLQTETMTLDETATPGEFTGVITTVFSLASTAAAGSGDGTVQAKSGDTIVFSFTDQLDAAGNGPIVRTDQTDVIGGEDGELKFTQVTQPGDVIYIRVTDLDLNQNPLAVETVQVVVTSTNTESEDVTLTELDVDDEVFFGSLNSTAGASAGTDDDGIINTAKGDSLTATYDDVLTSQGGLYPRTVGNHVVDPFGDADGNGQVQAFDAAQVLYHRLLTFSGNPGTLSGLDSLSANVDLEAPDSSIINGYDASLILQKRVALINIFPVQTALSSNHPQPAASSAKKVVETRRLALSHEDGYLSVRADERSGIVSGGLQLAGVDGRVGMAADLEDFLVVSRWTDEGLYVVFAGALPAEGPGELLRVYTGTSAAEVELVQAQFNGGAIVALADESVETATPSVFALHANWPNPFNPETTIAFDLPQAGRVELKIFDVLGQEVRTLVAESLPAGSHQTVWNGLDESSKKVSSGVYFYRLQTGNFTQMRRMLLIK